MKEEDVTSNALPYIYRFKRRIGKSGNVLEEKGLTVQGKNLKECEKVFNKEWRRKE